MRIDHRIRSTKIIRGIAGNNARLVCAILNPNAHTEKLMELGFSTPLELGESLVPSSHYGTACEENANGWVEVHRDQPMETAYRQALWRWRMKRGYGYEDCQKIVSVPYQRYPRTEHPPEGLELRITPKVDGSIVVSLPLRDLAADDDRLIRLSVNILVEIFGECYVLTEQLDQLVQAEIKRLNWRVLPPGARSWDQVKEAVAEVLESQPEKTKEVIEDRLQHINSHEPNFLAIGSHGFSGYLVMGFPQRGLYLLESVHFGNATYVLDENWEAHSRKTKGELIRQDLCLNRIIHRDGWHDQIDELFE